MTMQKANMQKNIKQFAIYLIVGAGATLVEWVMFYLLDKQLSLHYAISTTLAFIVSTFANWLLGRLLLFHVEGNKGLLKELGGIYLTAVFGLLFNLLIMWVAIDIFTLDAMLSKIIATGIVFFWNFFVRKFLIYKV